MSVLGRCVYNCVNGTAPKYLSDYLIAVRQLSPGLPVSIALIIPGGNRILAGLRGAPNLVWKRLPCFGKVLNGSLCYIVPYKHSVQPTYD